MAKLRRIHGLHRGKRIRVNIESLAPGGDGIAHFDGVAIFVARVAPGDTVDVEIFDVRKSFARGKAIEIVSSSRDRIIPICSVFHRCGGCQWQHVSYEAQLKTKQEIVAQALRHVENAAVEPVLPAPAVAHYRNKAQYPVKLDKKGRLLVGYYEDNSHRIVDLDQCPVQTESLDQVLRVLKHSLVDINISIYNEHAHTGMLRHICTRQSFFNKDILVTLVVNLADEAKLNEAAKQALKAVADNLMNRLAEVKGVCLNFNDSKGNKIFGNKTTCIAGEREIEEVLQSKRADRPDLLRTGIRFRLSSQSFFQVNTEQAVNLFDEVYDQVAFMKNELGKPLQIIDAYAGVGAIAMWVSSMAERVLAIEEVRSAVQDGHATIARNAIDNISFAEERAEDFLARMAKEKYTCDLVILDPPRKGASREVLDALVKLSPRFVIYVSCNPQTLARDLEILETAVLGDLDGKQVYTGYKTHRVKPVDLFPQTYHIESVATLERFQDDGSVGHLEKI